MENHVHDCTGPDERCPCGYVFSVPPISFSIEVFDRAEPLIQEHFNTDLIETVVKALREAADKLESSVMPIPTPEPPVKRYDLSISGQIYEVATGRIVTGGEVVRRCNECEALLLQRAQEIAELQEREALKLAACDVAALSNTRLTFARAQIERDNPAWSVAYVSVRNAVEREIAHREAIAARAQEIAQVQAENARLRQLRDQMRQLSNAWLKAGEGWEHDPAGRVVLRHGQVLRDTLAATDAAAAALVSRAPQPEQE